ncbi:MAG: galactokinase, partial [Spirochaetia bacterium]|nr:galactokinase [Spirochaetia bacterium]
NETVFRRARHAVSENERTKTAVAVLKKGDLAAFGKLMNASHVSLRDDYEVTGKELDSLVAAAWDAPGVLGSRMTGAGFGGCTVSLVNEADIPAFTQKVGERYHKETGLKADFYTASPGEGAGRIPS